MIWKNLQKSAVTSISKNENFKIFFLTIAIIRQQKLQNQNIIIFSNIIIHEQHLYKSQASLYILIKAYELIMNSEHVAAHIHEKLNRAPEKTTISFVFNSCRLLTTIDPISIHIWNLLQLKNR